MLTIFLSIIFALSSIKDEIAKVKVLPFFVVAEVFLNRSIKSLLKGQTTSIPWQHLNYEGRL